MNPYNSNPFENNEPRELRNEYDANRAMQRTALESTETGTEYQTIIADVRAHARNVMETDNSQLVDAFALAYIAQALATANRKRA